MSQARSEAVEEYTTHYYSVVQRCLEQRRLWDKVVRKFSPKALESAVRRVVERFVEAGRDPEEFNWCTFFTQILDHPTVESFVEWLIRERYVPPSKREELEELIAQLEREAKELGYRLVKEEEWARVTGRWDRLVKQISTLQEQKRILEARVRELEKKVEEYEKSLLRFYREKPREVVAKEVVTPPTAVAEVRPRARYRLLKDVMTYGDFVLKLQRELEFYGLPSEVAKEIVVSVEDWAREIYETAADWQEYDARLKLLEWTRKEWLPRNAMLLTYDTLAKAGIEVRPPNPLWMFGQLRRPSIDYIRPRFLDWADGVARSGYTVYTRQVPLEKEKTVIIHEPVINTQDVKVYVRNKEIILINVHALVYYLDHTERRLVYYFYRSGKELFI